MSGMQSAVYLKLIPVLYRPLLATDDVSQRHHSVADTAFVLTYVTD
jgi:hypothetical protein